MEKIGSLYKNKTLLYLLPCLNIYGQGLSNRINNHLFVLKVGLKDQLMTNAHYDNFKSIYILVDKFYKTPLFDNFIRYIRYQDYYVTDYSFIQSTDEVNRKHMIVLKIPERHHVTYDKFIKGKYSEMYNEDEIKTYFKEDSPSLNVLNKTDEQGIVFLDILKQKFNVNLTLSDLQENNMEYELPVNFDNSEEIFNYSLTPHNV